MLVQFQRECLQNYLYRQILQNDAEKMRVVLLLTSTTLSTILSKLPITEPEMRRCFVNYVIACNVLNVPITDDISSLTTSDLTNTAILETLNALITQVLTVSTSNRITSSYNPKFDKILTEYVSYLLCLCKVLGFDLHNVLYNPEVY